MRISFQIKVILWAALLLSFPVSASAISFFHRPYTSFVGPFSSADAACLDIIDDNPDIVDWYVDSDEVPSDRSGYYGFGYCYGLVSDGSVQYRKAIYADEVPPPDECEVWAHEADPDLDPDYIHTACGYCESGWADAGEDFDGIRCQLIEEKSDCQAKGESFQEWGDGFGYCVPECENGSLNGLCLDDPVDNSSCDENSPDFRGNLPVGWGEGKVAICGDVDQCSGDGTGGQIGWVNGEVRCVPDDYGPPLCDSDSLLVVDPYGFTCELLSDTPDEEVAQEQPNTDTDGDGEPDEYQSDNDPNAIGNAADKIADAVGGVEGAVNDVGAKVSGTNDRLDDVNKNLGDVKKALDGVNENLNDGLGTANQLLASIDEKLEQPDGGYSTDGLGTAPEFSESTTVLKNAFFNNPTVQAISNVPGLGSSTTCPVYTIPATKFWDSMVMDTHCTIFEQYRSTLSYMFMFFWTITAIFVFLRS